MATIEENLSTYWDYFTKMFKEDQILCIYRYSAGDHVFTYEALYLPTYEEICCIKPHNSVYLIEGEQVMLRNIQTIFWEGFLVNSEQVYDLFTTPNVKVNPRYENMFNTCFRGKFAEIFLNETQFARTYYQAQLSLETERSLRQRDLLKDVMKQNEKYSLAHKHIEEYSFYPALRRMVCAILSISQKREDVVVKKANAEDTFFPEFTANELKVLKAITEEIQLEGNVSIVKMIQKTGYSRPVFTSALNKLTQLRLAEVVNQGVKGTHIKFVHQGFFIELRNLDETVDWSRIRKGEKNENS